MQSQRYGHHLLRANGFTIVELLIVVVVIAILAAITIVAYNGITQRANAAAAQSATEQALKKLMVYAVDHNDTYPSDLASLGLVNSAGITYQYSVNNSTTPAGYCVTATANGVSYYLGSNYSYNSASSGTINQTNPSSGLCPGHSSTGTSISNFSYNPGAEIDNNGYGQPNSSVVVRDTSKAYQGVASMKTTMPANTSGNVGISIYQIGSLGGVNSLQPNSSYVASAYVYVPSGTVNPFITIQGTGRATKDDPAGNGTSLKNQWVRIYNTFTTGASGTLSIFILNNATTTAGMQFWVDNVMISEGSSLPNYADGNSSGWVWSGAQNASASSGPAL